MENYITDLFGLEPVDAVLIGGIIILLKLTFGIFSMDENVGSYAPHGPKQLGKWSMSMLLSVIATLLILVTLLIKVFSEK